MIRALSAIMKSNLRVFIVTAVALSLASSAWALATPLGASPDEPSHFIKAASVVRGQFIGDDTDEPSLKQVDVPVGIAEATTWDCYAFEPGTSAACIPPVSDGLELAEGVTSAGLYNPLYYAAVGWPTLFIADTESALFAVRILSGIITSLFFAFAFTLLLRMVTAAIAGLAFLAGMTPMVLFLSGSVNPNSLEIASAAALLVGLLYITLDFTGIRHSRILVAAAVAGVVLANTRGLSPLWMALIAVIVLILTPWSRTQELVRTRQVLITLGVLALGVVLAGAWLAFSNSLNSMGTFSGAGEASPARAFAEMIVNRSMDPGIIGVLGWLDTFLPSIVYFIWSGLFVLVAVLSFSLARRRAFLAFLFALGTVILGPPVIQAASVQNSGYIWQGRYTLVAVVYTLLVGAIAIQQSGYVSRIPHLVRIRASILIGAAFIFAQGYSMLAAIRRYADPGSGSLTEFIQAPEWSPPGTAVPWMLLVVLASAALVAVWIGARSDLDKRAISPALELANARTAEED